MSPINAIYSKETDTALAADAYQTSIVGGSLRAEVGSVLCIVDMLS